jgi:predicted RNA-binding Zn-ribbon protein involved in translation (DUF1610 family)
MKEKPGRMIIIFEATDIDYEESWLADDYPDIYNIENLWVLRLDKLEWDALEEQLNQMFNILDGKVWKVGCSTGLNKDMYLLMVEKECPKCGQKVWIPDHILLSALPVHDFTEKPWLYSLESILIYSMDMIRQVADVYNKHKKNGGVMRLGEKGFSVDCNCCGTETIKFDEKDREYFYFEVGDISQLARMG